MVQSEKKGGETLKCFTPTPYVTCNVRLANNPRSLSSLSLSNRSDMMDPTMVGFIP